VEVTQLIPVYTYTLTSAALRPASVMWMCVSVSRLTNPSRSRRPTISCTVGADSCIARARFAAVMGRPASCSQNSVWRYSSSATVASAMADSVCHRLGHPMRIPAKADYAVRAAIELAAAGEDAVVKGERLAGAQDIPLHFLENILGDLRQAGIVTTRRGPEGGYRLARPPAEISVADVIRAVDGPLA